MSLWRKVLKQIFHKRYIDVTNLLRAVAFAIKTMQKKIKLSPTKGFSSY